MYTLVKHFIIPYLDPLCLKHHQVTHVKEKAQNVTLHFTCTFMEFTNVSLIFFGKALDIELPKLVSFTVLEFNEVIREHSGSYVLTTTFCHMGNCDEASTEEMNLDVLCKSSII